MVEQRDVLDYASGADDRRAARRRAIKIIAAAVSVVACAAPTVVAVWAWLAHLAWQRSGVYGQNSFPMNAFAEDMTWIAGCTWAMALGGWGAAWWGSGRSGAS